MRWGLYPLIEKICPVSTVFRKTVLEDSHRQWWGCSLPPTPVFGRIIGVARHATVLLVPHQYTELRFITHSKEFAGNQGKRQNFNPSSLPYKFGEWLKGTDHTDPTPTLRFWHRKGHFIWQRPTPTGPNSTRSPGQCLVTKRYRPLQRFLINTKPY